MQLIAAWLKQVAVIVFVACAVLAGTADAEAPTPAAKRAAPEIRRAATLPPNGPEGRPLPLASHWNFSWWAGQHRAQHQTRLLQEGHRILPWLAWPIRNPGSREFEAYDQPLLAYVAQLKLPFTLVGTQWEWMLVDGAHGKRPDTEWAGVITPLGQRLKLLSPFAPSELWKEPASKYVANDAMRAVQRLYPDPPRVIFLSNNEAGRLNWERQGPLEAVSYRYLKTYGLGRGSAFKRKVMADGWAEKYRTLFAAMRAGLTEPAWRERARFIGYNAFGSQEFGRGDWLHYAWGTDDLLTTEARYWDGGSPSYYTHNWTTHRDHWLHSPQVECMNWIFMQDEAWRISPDYWFELSIWDGNKVETWTKGLGLDPGDPVAAASRAMLAAEAKDILRPDLVTKSKVFAYLADGQTYPPERYGGWVQFGMWLTRPRVVREWRPWTTAMPQVEPYWMQIVSAVDRVHDTPVLQHFWRYGQLVANAKHEHPYQSYIPQKYRESPRWFLLDTNLDPPRPWSLTTDIPVFSLALVDGAAPSRRWLIYAHSPLADRAGVRVMVPAYGDVRIDVSRGGSFYVFDEARQTAEPVLPPQ